MTHPTDEELDALVARLKQLEGRMSFQSQNIAGASACRLAADAITTLRARLAEVKAEKEKLGRELNLARYGEPDFAWQTHKEALAEANARADRAEAALAAQIEADAGIADMLVKSADAAMQLATDDEHSVKVGVASQKAMAQRISAFIRNQPHDRTALDRLLAEAREQALREAGELVRSTAYTSNGDSRSLEPVSACLVGMDMHHATIADAILALIESADAQK